MVLSIAALGLARGAAAADQVRPDADNCLLCHRYPSIGRFDESGVKRIFYVNGQKFAHSVHGKLNCTSCHLGLDKIPHTDIKKVDCTTQCHIKEPSTDREFSHGNMADKYLHSVHGQGSPDRPKPFPEDLPTCKYCHQNRTKNPMGGLWGMSAALANETLSRCTGCHTKENWAQNFYVHFTQRMRRVRSQTEIVELCTSCHEDRAKMARHGLESIGTFKDTFHWNLIKYQVKNAPDCISCHVPVGYTTHDLRPKSDPASSINPINRVSTCSNQGGIQACHPGATVQFATGRVHAYGTKAQIAAGGAPPVLEGVDETLLIRRARQETSEEELFHAEVLGYIRLFYKLFIPMVVGFMFYHQWMDYLATLRRQRKRRKLGQPSR
jgi:hypothetical protein